MIKNIKLKFGRAEGLPQETVEVMPITVFVGPLAVAPLQGLA
jgi:hypothetical protein